MECKNEKSLSLRELQQIELQLLHRFIEICDEYQIKYYIIGGALLGAVRHGGFIPWDDDIDVAVPRCDYRKLIATMAQIRDSTTEMCWYKEDESLYYYPVKIVDPRYKLSDPRLTKGYGHPAIDVLPLDGMPDGRVKASVFRFRMLVYRLLLGLHYVDNIREVKRSPLERMLIRFGKLTGIGRWIDPTSVKDRIDRLLSSNDIENCSVIGTCMGAYFFHEFVPKSYFGAGSYVSFEDIKVRAPERVDAYLRHMYGDYMQLPPEAERKSKHLVLIKSDSNGGIRGGG